MHKILFGSCLVKKLFPDFRNPNDIDWIVFNPSEASSVRTIDGVTEEFHYLPLAPKNREMTPDEIYTLKVSHAIRDIHWSKTMSDIRFLQIKNCKLIPSFLIELRDYWNLVHGENKRTSFQVGAKDFFKDNIKRKMEHDKLHTLLKDPPSYLKIVDANGVTPVEAYFNGLTHQEQIEVAFEEAFVISSERYSDLPECNAYHLAQRALVTRLHPQWLADYVISKWSSEFWNARNSALLFEEYKKIRKELNK